MKLSLGKSRIGMEVNVRDHISGFWTLTVEVPVGLKSKKIKL